MNSGNDAIKPLKTAEIISQNYTAQSENVIQQMQRRARWQTRLALCVVVGAMLVSPASRHALAQATGSLGQLWQRVTADEAAANAVASRVTALEAKVTALQNQLATLKRTPGPQGPKGDKGDRGAIGAQGPQGLKGDKGATGAQGVAGIQGPKGDKGLTGAQGAQGLPGKNGTNGINGTNGKDGLNGKDGTNGKDADMTRVAVLESSVQKITAQTGELKEHTLGLIARCDILDTKTQYLSVVDGETFLTGTNLHIVNGMGATNGYPANPASLDPDVTRSNGMGNLILGYNEVDIETHHGTIRGGSHNLVIGSYNNYDGYGGMVVGSYNSILGAFSSVSGGMQNTASGDFASISGGNGNIAQGDGSSVSGGWGWFLTELNDWKAGVMP